MRLVTALLTGVWVATKLLVKGIIAVCLFLLVVA